jgi:hypothetical protein
MSSRLLGSTAIVAFLRLRSLDRFLDAIAAERRVSLLKEANSLCYLTTALATFSGVMPEIDIWHLMLKRYGEKAGDTRHRPGDCKHQEFPQKSCANDFKGLELP